MILVGGKDDGVITPWESRCIMWFKLHIVYAFANCSQFSFFANDNVTVVPMKKQEVRLIQPWRSIRDVTTLVMVIRYI